jgi:hypothetical protein
MNHLFLALLIVFQHFTNQNFHILNEREHDWSGNPNYNA